MILQGNLGTLPAFRVVPTIKDVLAGKGIQMESAMKEITNMP